jgi:rhamnose transport system substrate-binding protein
MTHVSAIRRVVPLSKYRRDSMPHHVARSILAVALVAVAALAIAACGSTKKSTSNSDDQATSGSANPSAQIKKGLTVAFLPKQVNNPYFTVADKGGIQAMQQVGGKGKEVGPSNAEASAQVPFIDTLTSQKVDAIAISANDPNAVVPALKKAQQQGIKVVSYDADTAPAGRSIFVNQASPEALGRSEVQVLGKQLGYKGQIAILSATPNAANQNAWIGFMKKELAQPKYANMKLVKVAYGNDDDQKSFSETQGLLQAYPNLKGIISPTTVGIAAAARYLQGSKYKGKVALTGLGTPNQMRKFVEDGTVQSFELWDPAQLGYLAGYAAAALASGQISGKQGETFKAGKLGTRKVGPKGEVILGPPKVFDKSNIDQFNF